MVIGLVVVVAGIVALLDALTVNIPWGVVLPAAIVLIGLILLLNPRSAAAGGWITVGAIFIGKTFGIFLFTILGRLPRQKLEIRNPNLFRRIVRFRVSNFGSLNWAYVDSNHGPQLYQTCALAD